jgi:hypothetical protein
LFNKLLSGQRYNMQTQFILSRAMDHHSGQPLNLRSAPHPFHVLFEMGVESQNQPHRNFKNALEARR